MDIEDHRMFIFDVIQDRTMLQIDIFNSQERMIGYLLPVTAGVVENNEIIHKMTKWRNRAMKYFLTQFTATPERTKYWLHDLVLRDSSRLLFLIYSNNKLIGQHGFKDLSSTSVELDNLIRGEIGGHPRLVYYAEIALIRWLFKVFNMERIFGCVLSHNQQAIDLHCSIGFQPMELIPLYKFVNNGEIEFKMGKAGGSSPDEIYYQRMELRQDSFNL